MEAKCNFYSKKSYYVCEVKEIKGIALEKALKRISGKNEQGKTYNDVFMLRIENKQIGFIPRNLHKFFPKLKLLHMHECDLKELSRQDLKGLEDIEIVTFSSNKLTSLPDDLFADMKKLRWIDFGENQIKRMSSNLLLPIKANLEYVNFEDNSKINECFDLTSENKNDLEKFMRNIDACCLSPLKAPQPSSRAEKAFSEFTKFKTSGEFSDFTIAFRGKEFKIHKVIFAAQSSVFQKMFSGDVEEGSPNALNNIKNSSDETFESFIDYFYTGKVDAAINGVELFELASEFDVSELKQVVKQQIIAQLDVTNAVAVFDLAHRRQEEELKEKSFEMLKTMMPELEDSHKNKLDKVNKMVALKAQLEQLLEETILVN